MLFQTRGKSVPEHAEGGRKVVLPVRSPRLCRQKGKVPSGADGLLFPGLTSLTCRPFLSWFMGYLCALLVASDPVSGRMDSCP